MTGSGQSNIPQNLSRNARRSENGDGRWADSIVSRFQVNRMLLLKTECVTAIISPYSRGLPPLQEQLTAPTVLSLLGLMKDLTD